MLEILDAQEHDAEELLGIYDYYVKNTAITFEIETPSVNEFKERIKTIKKNYPYIILKDDNKIVGYAYSNVFKGREAYKYSTEVTIYLDHNLKGKGYGKILYAELEKRLRLQGIKNLYACIASPVEIDKYLDNNSEEFHNHIGYKRIGLFTKCGYKFNTWYNMIWMEKLIGEHN